LRFRTADLTATRKHVPICLPRPSAPLQSITTHVSRLCSSSLGSASTQRRTHPLQPDTGADPGNTTNRISRFSTTPTSCSRRRRRMHSVVASSRIRRTDPDHVPLAASSAEANDELQGWPPQGRNRSSVSSATTSRVRHCEHNKATEDSTGPLARQAASFEAISRPKSFDRNGLSFSGTRWRASDAPQPHGLRHATSEDVPCTYEPQ